ncbi:MAG TPA: CHRD domain-containing protein [Bryobacteraceae bacterium]|nr:CHRD domain-containing protein [Bryobacteraceae bacterium]
MQRVSLSKVTRFILLFSVCALITPAAVLEFTGNLAPEVAGSSGFGSAEVTYDSVAHTLLVSFDWNNLTGTTTVAHIHCCVDPPGTAGVATFPGTFPGFPMGTTSGSYTSPAPIDLTLASSYTMNFLNNFGGGTAAGAEAALVQGLMDSRAYLNVHTTFAMGGEIRDFLAPVPEPGTYALVGCALAGVVISRLRRRSAV